MPIRGSKVDATRICVWLVKTRGFQTATADLLDHVKLSLPETNSVPMKISGWKMKCPFKLSFQMVYFERLCVFSGSVRLIGHEIAGTIQNCHITLCTGF